MATKGIYFYKLVSPYSQDIVKNCKLSINEIDSNFFSLEEYDIKTAEFIREEKVLVLTRVNGEKLVVDLNDVTYNLDVKKDCGDSGTTLTISYDGNDGEKVFTIDNIITADNIKDIIKREEKVVTDSSLKGIGNMSSPLGIKETEKTGMFQPADYYLDLTNGGTLPIIAKNGTVYLTKEYVSEFGYLYNGAALDKIKERLAAHGNGWRIPTKADWDALLNSVEPCEYRNHNSSKCHVELGKYASKFLKSACGWLDQEECQCVSTEPHTGVTTEPTFDEVDGTSTNEPSENIVSPKGVDKFGYGILPSGSGELNSFKRPTTNYYKEKGVFWTSSHVYSDVEQDVYVKIFDWNKGGVMQAAVCPEVYYSLRLVKDFDGSNYSDVEYIDGVPYKTIVNVETNQIWLASNYSSIDGLIGYVEGGETPDYIEVNNGEVMSRRKEIFINVWNGYYWEKKLLSEGDTIVVKNPCFDGIENNLTNISWTDSEGVTHTIEIEIPASSQYNKEYRIYTDDESCDKILVNTDDLVIERVLNVLIPILENEREERIAADNAINERIDNEITARISGDVALADAIEAEIERAVSAETELADSIEAEIDRAISAETELNIMINEESERAITAEEELREAISGLTSGDTEIWEALSAETNARISGDAALNEALATEIERAIENENNIEGQLIELPTEENPYIIKVRDGLELRLKNGGTIKIDFDGNYGEI